MFNTFKNKEIINNEKHDLCTPVGFPSPARDYRENSLDLNNLMIANPQSTYFVRVEGYSMKNANIYPEDILVVDRSLPIVNNQIVVAILDGEFVVKRLKIKDNIYWLCPENDEYQAVRIEEWMDFSVWGVVTWVIQKKYLCSSAPYS